MNDSIPKLADADPEQCGIAIVLPDGTIRVSAQADLPFSIQSAV